MIRLLANENSAIPAVRLLERLGYDIIAIAGQNLLTRPGFSTYRQLTMLDGVFTRQRPYEEEGPDA